MIHVVGVDEYGMRYLVLSLFLFLLFFPVPLMTAAFSIRRFTTVSTAAAFTAAVLLRLLLLNSTAFCFVIAADSGPHAWPAQHSISVHYRTNRRCTGTR
eukprot:20708-Heterococcus_DN1.PRE.3